MISEGLMAVKKNCIIHINGLKRIKKQAYETGN